MKFINKKDNIIRTLKDIAGVICVVIAFFAILLMFCEPAKVADMLFSREVIGLFGLATGGIIGFIISAFMTYKHFSAEIAMLEKALANSEKLLHKKEQQLIDATVFINNFITPQKKPEKTADNDRSKSFFRQISGLSKVSNPEKEISCKDDSLKDNTKEGDVPECPSDEMS